MRWRRGGRGLPRCGRGWSRSWVIRGRRNGAIRRCLWPKAASN